MFCISLISATQDQCNGIVKNRLRYRQLQIPNPTNFTVDDWIAEDGLSQIINGIQLTPRQYPFLVSVQWRSGTIFRWACGAALLSSQWILTAAHCLDQKSPNRLVFGGHNLVDEQEGRDLCPESQMLNTEDIFIHPEWRRSTGENDIALIKVSQNVSYKSISILDQYQLKYQARVMGWGKDQNGKTTRIPYYAQVNLMDIDACKETYQVLSPSSVISSQQICVRGGDTGSCQGDSGGPLVYTKGNDTFLLGTVSWSVGCAGNPTIFARTAAYIDWICQITTGQVCCTSERCVAYNDSPALQSSSSPSSPPYPSSSSSPISNSNSTSQSPMVQSGNRDASPPPSPASGLPTWVIPVVIILSCILVIFCVLFAIGRCYNIDAIVITQ
tara:strand:- start:670 stop:1824 length:1155 start_codon:yes stop_codon:yes gene_type:complete